MSPLCGKRKKVGWIYPGIMPWCHILAGTLESMERNELKRIDKVPGQMRGIL